MKSMAPMRWNSLVIAFLVGCILHGHVNAKSPRDRRKVEKQNEMDVVLDVDHHEISPVEDVSVEAGGAEGTSDTYSVIVVSRNKHRSNLFRDEKRMHTYSRGVVSVQVANPNPTESLLLTPDSPPFYVGHPPDASKRVRIYHSGGGHMSAEVFSHVEAACKDPSERTLILLTDEYCSSRPLTETLPSACWPHIARHYPISPASPELEPRHAYIPLGPRDTFPFVDASERARSASERPIFFSVAVTDATAPRRVLLVNITSDFREENPTLNAFVNDEKLDSQHYRSLLLNSTFTVCPGGHNPETYRMFESLEAGSIPIISRRDYLYPSYKAPFPCGEGEASWNTVAASPFAQQVSVGSWDELPDLLLRLNDEPAEYIDQLQAECIAWYETLIRRTYKSMLNFGQGYDLWPQNGPLVFDGFPASSEPYPDAPPYDQDEV